MEKYIDIFEQCPLFLGIRGDNLAALLSCLSAAERRYEKNSYIFSAEDTVKSIGVVLSGRVHIVREDYWGARSILAAINPGGLFGEAFTCAEAQKLPVSVYAPEMCEVMLIDYRRIITTCPASCEFHARLIRNMLTILAKKNIMLTQKIEVLTQRTTRDKLLAYLSSQAQAAGRGAFEIPFNRQELAEYLSVDRSAMSGELSKMSRDGLIRYTRNKFELL